MGIFYPYGGSGVDLVGVEAAGYGIDTGKHGASLGAGTPGVLHGAVTYLLQDDDGQVLEAHSLSAGLDYPGVGPEHAWFKDAGSLATSRSTDDEAVAALHLMARDRRHHPGARICSCARMGRARVPTGSPARTVVLNLSGRGDKDVQQIAALDD